MREGDVNLHEDLETLRVLNVKEHNSLNTQIHPLLNSYYIEDITNASIKLAIGEGREVQGNHSESAPRPPSSASSSLSSHTPRPL